MLLIWLKIIFIALTAISGITAHYKRRRFLLFATAICALLAITIELVSNYTEKQSEQERVADLKYIQALNLPVVRVGFDLTVQSVPEYQNSRFMWFCQYQRHASMHIAGEGYSCLIGLRFSGASYVSISSAYNLDVELDTSASNHVILWINEFGIRTSKGEMIWQPKIIGDLSGVVMTMGIDKDPPPAGAFARKFESPVKKVEIYVNSNNSSNKIALATPKYEKRWLHYSFLPNGASPFVDESYASFYLNPYELRGSILDSIRRN
jgi:hypothetical protein